MFPPRNIPTKTEIADRVLTIINEWLERSKIVGKVIYRGWLDENEATITYDGFSHSVKCDLAVFLNIDNIIYRVFINFKINHFKYELNARKKALLIERKNGLVSYDLEAKKAFKIAHKDKNAIFIFVVNNISDEQTNSWSSRVLCCHYDNILPTIKHQLSEIKIQTKNSYKSKASKSLLKSD
ncbi:MAG: hypothetical protein K2H80_01350 [Ureaplasma sp.]|nr:hypothetical protein [Ureaplasma sp.]